MKSKYGSEVLWMPSLHENSSVAYGVVNVANLGGKLWVDYVTVVPFFSDVYSRKFPVHYLQYLSPPTAIIWSDNNTKVEVTVGICDGSAEDIIYLHGWAWLVIIDEGKIVHEEVREIPKGGSTTFVIDFSKYRDATAKIYIISEGIDILYTHNPFGVLVLKPLQSIFDFSLFRFPSLIPY